jgi:hypothetical protein
MVKVGKTSRFATLTLYQNRIFVGTMSGIVAVLPQKINSGGRITNN